MVIVVDKKKIIKNIFIIFLFAFVVSYIIEKSGYYEYNLEHRTVLTSESMKKFEKDVSEGKDVTIEEYTIPTLKWENIPSNSKSFVIEFIVNNDEENPSWHIINIPAKIWKLVNIIYVWML